jgi:hypothetical protein
LKGFTPDKKVKLENHFKKRACSAQAFFAEVFPKAKRRKNKIKK